MKDRDLRSSLRAQQFEAALQTLHKHRATSKRKTKIFLRNFSFFESNRDEIGNTHPGQWVAALNGVVYASSTHKGVQEAIKRKPGKNYAYTEQIPATPSNRS